MLLVDIGENRIIEEILSPRYSDPQNPDFGDDCAVVYEAPKSDISIVATTDPCPIPMARTLGYTDLYYWGWLLATINLSDLAAMGAQPIALLTSLVLKNETELKDFKRLLDGIDECCKRFTSKVVGGNIKEGEDIALTATALGSCRRQEMLTRIGCKEGDLIVIIGDVGLFWAGVRAIEEDLLSKKPYKEELLRNVLTPMPKVAIAQAIAKNHLLSSCIDNSDGLYTSLMQLSQANNVGMDINIEYGSYSEPVIMVSEILGIDPVRFALGWGDWQLIGCVDRSQVNDLKELGDEYATPITVIGQVVSKSGIIIEHQGKRGRLAPIDSQRFTRESWFSAGIKAYRSMLFDGPIIVS